MNDYVNSGISKASRGDLRGAIEDFDLAIQADPNYADAYYHRGVLRYYAGLFGGALEDLNRTIEIVGKQTKPAKYAMVWIWIVEAQSGNSFPATEKLHKFISEALGNDWIDEVLKYYAGYLNEDELTEAAAYPFTPVERQQICEANFFIAHLHLPRNHKLAAKKHFRRCITGITKHLSTHWHARRELEKLGE